MSLLSRLERKFQRYAIPNVTLMIIIGQVLLYVIARVSHPPGGAVGGGVDLLDRVRLDPAKILDGEVWRLITFVFDPPLTNVIFAFFFWYLFYLMGSTLEVSWGAFRYNVFLTIGYVATVAAAFASHFTAGPGQWPATNAFLYGTVFLAFARLYPEFVMYLFFVLPVKIRWLAMLQWIFYGITFLFGDWMQKAMVAASVANYLLFFGRDILSDMRQGHRRMKFQARSLRSPRRVVHKCRSCGLTSESAPQMQFRYCSKCDADSCYCTDHLHNHEHVARAAEAAGKK
jgi:hypothetical protein